MAKTSKTPKTEVSASTVAPAPTPAPVTVSAPEKKEKKAKKEPVSAPTPAVTDTVTVSATEENVVVDEVDVAVQTATFLSRINEVSALLTSLKTEFRTLEKKWSRELKTAQKSQSKRKNKSVVRKPSGFVKPTKISDELAKFLDKPVGTEMARTDVTKEITQYIRSHNLQDSTNGRKINPDSKLQSLLRLKKEDELTYFNLQRYMSPHFPKAVKTA